MYKQSQCVSAQGHFCPLGSPIFSLQFSLHFGEKTFKWARGGNTQTPPFIFLPPHPTKYTPKKFSFPFSLQSFPSILFHLQTNLLLVLRNRFPLLFFNQSQHLYVPLTKSCTLSPKKNKQKTKKQKTKTKTKQNLALHVFMFQIFLMEQVVVVVVGAGGVFMKSIYEL